MRPLTHAGPTDPRARAMHGGHGSGVAWGCPDGKVTRDFLHENLSFTIHDKRCGKFLWLSFTLNTNPPPLIKREIEMGVDFNFKYLDVNS